MFDIYTVSLFGHRELSDMKAAEKALEPIVQELITKKEFVEFLVCREGEFDMLATYVIRRVRKRLDYGNCSLVLVLPYSKAEYRNNVESFEDFYDEIEICEQSENAHYLAAYQKRNRVMVDRSDLVICCIEHESGGAFQTFEYAKKQKKPVQNVGYCSLPSKK